MSKRERWLLTALAALGLILACIEGPSDGTLLAMPPLVMVVVYAVAAYAGYIGIAQAVIMIALTIYGAISAKDKERRARNQARDAYNASLQDRTATFMASDAPWQFVYGEAVVGGLIVAVLTSGDKDQYKHVVIRWANHECEAILDFMINGVSVGALNSGGYVTGGAYREGNTSTATFTGTVDGSGRIELFHNFARVVSVTWRQGYGVQDRVQASLDGSDVVQVGTAVQLVGADIAEWAGRSVSVTVDQVTGTPRLRVRHHLGSPTQTADSDTMAECPGDWGSTDRLQGICYSVVRLDLNVTEFQGGPPQMSVRLKGRKVYDHRTGNTAWSDNAALCTADFLMAEWGKQAVSSQLVWSSVDATANACDEALSSHAGAKRFTCNGSLTTDQSPDSTLDALCQSMAGFVTYTGAWHMQAGVYAAPVMDLGDADNLGSVEGVADESALALFNGLRGQFFDPARAYQRTDYTPYQNAAFVSEDGAEIWAPLNLPFTNATWRCHNLARIQVERSRGMQLVVPCKRRALKLRVGQRVRYSNSTLGISLSVFRVVKREYQLGKPVTLTLAQDALSWYDETDDPGTLPSPAVHQANPFQIAPVSGLTAQSGTATLLLQSDGTVVSRIKVSVAASTDTLVIQGGALQIEYRRDADTAWQRAPEASGSATEAYLLGLEELELFVIRARWRNGLGAVGDWRSTSVLHVGKSQPPDAPSGFAYIAAPGGVMLTWTASAEPDYLDSQIRHGSVYSSATQLWQGSASSYLWLQGTAGTYTVWITHRDTSGNVSTPVSMSVVVTAASASLLQVEYSVDGLTGWHANFTTGDIYMRQRVGSTGPWQGPIKIVGSDGSPGLPGDPGSPGSPGANGTRTAEAKVYSNPVITGTGSPSISGTATYTWASASLSAAPSSWNLTPPSPGPGYSVYVAVVRISNTNTTATDTVNWTGASVSVFSSASLRGGSARIAYAKSTTNPLAGSPTSVTTSGSTSHPATNTWGGGEVWGSTVPSFSAGESVFQINGIYDPATDSTTWGLPFLSSLKVGSLSAITANMGALTVDTALTMGSSGMINQGAYTGFSWPASGTGFHLGPLGLLMGNNNTGGYVEINADGSYVDIGKAGGPRFLWQVVGGVGGMSLTGASLNAGTITGAVLQTASSGRRAVVNEGGANTIRLYGDVGSGNQMLVEIGKAGSGVYGLSYSLASMSDGVLSVDLCSSSGGAVLASTSGTLAAVRAISFSSARAVDATGDIFATGSVTAKNGIQCADPFGAAKGILYYNSGAVKLEANGASPIQIATNGSVVATFPASGGLQVTNGFGCNGKGPQAAQASGGTLSGVINALVNVGILSS